MRKQIAGKHSTSQSGSKTHPHPHVTSGSYSATGGRTSLSSLFSGPLSSSSISPSSPLNLSWAHLGLVLDLRYRNRPRPRGKRPRPRPRLAHFSPPSPSRSSCWRRKGSQPITQPQPRSPLSLCPRDKWEPRNQAALPKGPGSPGPIWWVEELTHQVVLLALGCILGVPVLLPVSLLEVSAGAAGAGVAVAGKGTPSPATASGPELLLKRRRQSRPESEGPACQFAGGGGIYSNGKGKGNAKREVFFASGKDFKDFLAGDDWRSQTLLVRFNFKKITLERYVCVHTPSEFWNV